MILVINTYVDNIQKNSPIVVVVIVEYPEHRSLVLHLGCFRLMIRQRPLTFDQHQPFDIINHL